MKLITDRQEIQNIAGIKTGLIFGASAFALTSMLIAQHLLEIGKFAEGLSTIDKAGMAVTAGPAAILGVAAIAVKGFEEINAIRLEKNKENKSKIQKLSC